MPTGDWIWPGDYFNFKLIICTSMYVTIFELCHRKRAFIAYANSMVQASLRLRIHAVSPEPILLAHLSGRPKENLSQELDMWPS